MGMQRPTPQLQDRPAVLDIINSLEAQRGALLRQLHDAALSLPGVEERALYDGFCREWTPAYYAGGHQLFHVHSFRAGLRATMFVGVRTLEPSILDSDEIEPELRLLVASTPGPRGTKAIKVHLDSAEDVAALMDMVRVKWESLR
jgi:hypothetical protein